MSIAKAIHQRMKQAGNDKSATILTIVSDDHNVHCLTEDHLDAWWASLDPVEKADVYEEHLEAQVVGEDEGLTGIDFGEANCSLPKMTPAIEQAGTDYAVATIASRVSQFAEQFEAIWRRKYRIDPQPLYTHLQPNTKGDHHDRSSQGV